MRIDTCLLSHKITVVKQESYHDSPKKLQEYPITQLMPQNQVVIHRSSNDPGTVKLWISSAMRLSCSWPPRSQKWLCQTAECVLAGLRLSKRTVTEQCERRDVFYIPPFALHFQMCTRRLAPTMCRYLIGTSSTTSLNRQIMRHLFYHHINIKRLWQNFRRALR